MTGDASLEPVQSSDRPRLIITSVGPDRASFDPPDPWVDTSGLDSFWEVYETLAADQSLSESQWHELFAASGYLQLEWIEHRSRRMKPVFEQAFRPSLMDDPADFGTLDQMVRTMVLPHLQLAATQRIEIDAFVDQFAAQETLNQAIRFAQTYLPAGAADRKLLPPVYIIILDGDGTALDDGIVLDAYGLFCYPQPVMLLAHELHHI